MTLGAIANVLRGLPQGVHTDEVDSAGECLELAVSGRNSYTHRKLLTIDELERERKFVGCGNEQGALPGVVRARASLTGRPP